ncbi:Uncharacterized protein PBTT_07793 [Plasmodiophora brassicae]|uniref:Uncharacterized protein n=1 Tax=Plasmodiophora brassicae TaxID=37360 RepID=A0A0G4IY37_PLABS|nr:hypothetical protein PBRA_007720 [Plasmodiophora brassicae]
MQLRNVVPQWRVLNRGLATRGLATAKRDPTESQGARRARLAAAQAAVKEEARRRKMDELHAEIHWRVDAKLREIGVNPKKIWNLEYLTNPEAVTLMVCSEVLEKDLTQYEDGGEHYDPEMPVPEASAEDEVLDYIQKETGLYTEDPAITEGIRHIIRYRGLDKMSRQKIYDMTYGFADDELLKTAIDDTKRKFRCMIRNDVFIVPDVQHAAIVDRVWNTPEFQCMREIVTEAAGMAGVRDRDVLDEINLVASKFNVHTWNRDDPSFQAAVAGLRTRFKHRSGVLTDVEMQYNRDFDTLYNILLDRANLEDCCNFEAIDKEIQRRTRKMLFDANLDLDAVPTEDIARNVEFLVRMFDRFQTVSPKQHVPRVTKRPHGMPLGWPDSVRTSIITLAGRPVSIWKIH